ncbi:hypothetical protein BCR35DRAFT_348277 [Leucosporidium creatinivorum]|uniref:TRAF-type domain-containing protein n=1 Tax=Leucosporidium creatinivorum TaxID=106004 RepID=A0A1Y2D8T6_9BASI|nr:hypothetical protein BCR35DRAFT_348277 [Leucosporidium creatinivorum]
MRVGCLSEHEICQALSTRRLVDGLLVRCQQGGGEGCGGTHLLSERAHHLQYECPERLIECVGKCGAIFSAKQALDHVSTCPEALLPCEVGGWQCKKIKRSKMAIHLLGCEHYKCAYASQGCSFEGTRYDRDHHQSSYCDPLHRKLQDTSLELEAVSVDAKDQVDALSAELSHAHDYIYTLEEMIQDLKQKITLSPPEQPALVLSSPPSVRFSTPTSRATFSSTDDDSEASEEPVYPFADILEWRAGQIARKTVEEANKKRRGSLDLVDVEQPLKRSRDA